MDPCTIVTNIRSIFSLPDVVVRINELIDAGEKVHAVDSGGLPCMEIDTFDDLAAAHELALNIR